MCQEFYSNRDDDRVKIYEDEHVGEKIGIYEILYLNDYKSKDGHKVYHIKCTECGWECDIQYRHIKSLSKVCNHLAIGGSYIDFSGKNKWTNHRIRKIFNGMCSRCYNTNNDDYKWYGEKGIGVCKEWISNPLLFEEWALNNGYNDNLTIDRIESDKDYCPENCQWIPLEENSRKAGNVNWITVDDVTLTGRQWSEKLNLGINTINTITRKYNLEVAVDFIRKVMEKPELAMQRKPKQSFLSIYDIKVDC